MKEKSDSLLHVHILPSSKLFNGIKKKNINDRRKSKKKFMGTSSENKYITKRHSPGKNKLQKPFSRKKSEKIIYFLFFVWACPDNQWSTPKLNSNKYIV